MAFAGYAEVLFNIEFNMDSTLKSAVFAWRGAVTGSAEETTRTGLGRV
jgi:hypothetical protein